MLVISRDAPYLQAVTEVRERTTFVISNQLAVLREAAPRADAILVTVGEAGLLQAIFSVATRLRWVHSFAAGVEAFLFPDLVQSPVTLTNARGAYKRALAEFVMAAVLFFAKDLRRLVRNQEAGVWQPFDVDDVHGKVIGIIGYGETGRASAELAHAFGMRVLGLRRRPEQSRGDSLLESVFGPESLHEMLPLCDFVLLATPGTPQTRGMIGHREIGLMKADAIVFNPANVRLIYIALVNQVLHQPPNRIVSERGHDGSVHAKAPPQTSGDVVFAAAFPNAKAARRGYTAFARIEAQHHLTQAHQVPATILFRFDRQRVRHAAGISVALFSGAGSSFGTSNWMMASATR